MNLLEFAINMELDGEKYYTEQARLNKDNGLSKVFLLLAEDEKKHAHVLKNRISDISDVPNPGETLKLSKNIFSDLKNYKDDIKIHPSQLDGYKHALEKEFKSIELYKNLLSEADDDAEKLLIKFIIKEEESHFTVLEDMIELINNAEEWVESAEFNIEKEY